MIDQSMDALEWLRRQLETGDNDLLEARSLGARLPSNGNYVRTTAVYDPYEGFTSTPVLVSEMSNNPTITGRVSYKNTSQSAGGIKVEIRQRDMRYYADDWKHDAFKEKLARNSWVSDTCSGNTNWASCDVSTSEFLGTGQEYPFPRNSQSAGIYKVRVTNNATTAVYIDETGLKGGTNPS